MPESPGRTESAEAFRHGDAARRAPEGKSGNEANDDQASDPAGAGRARPGHGRGDRAAAAAGGRRPHADPGHRHAGRLAPVRARLPGRLAARVRGDPACSRWRVSRACSAARSTCPAGSYEYKVALNGAWDENYGAGGAPGGADIPLTAPGGADHLHLRPRHPRDQRRPAQVGRPPSRPRTGCAATVIAWDLPDQRAGFSYRLYWAAEGGLVNDDGEITGGQSVPLTADPGRPLRRAARASSRTSRRTTRSRVPRQCPAPDRRDPHRPGRRGLLRRRRATLVAATGVQTARRPRRPVRRRAAPHASGRPGSAGGRRCRAVGADREDGRPAARPGRRGAPSAASR